MCQFTPIRDAGPLPCLFLVEFGLDFRVLPVVDLLAFLLSLWGVSQLALLCEECSCSLLLFTICSIEPCVATSFVKGLHFQFRLQVYEANVLASLRFPFVYQAAF